MVLDESIDVNGIGDFGNVAVSGYNAVMKDSFQDVFWQTLLTRRSIRRYQQKQIPRALIERLLKAAIWAPNAHNRQPWRFAVVMEPARQDLLARRLAARWEEEMKEEGVPLPEIARRTERSYQRITAANVLIAGCLTMAEMDVYGDERRRPLEWQMAVQSTALALVQLLLAAHHEGVAACWLCAPLFAPDVVREALALPEDWEPQALITLGYAAEVRESQRKPLEEVVLWR